RRFAPEGERTAGPATVEVRPAPASGIFHRIEWREQPALPAAPAPLSGSWIVLDEGAGLGARAAAALAARGAAPVRVEMGQDFAQLAPDRFRVNPLAPGDF